MENNSKNSPPTPPTKGILHQLLCSSKILSLPFLPVPLHFFPSNKYSFSPPNKVTWKKKFLTDVNIIGK